MNKLSPFLLGLSIAVAGTLTATAQEQSPATPSIPKVLEITREYVKPGKSGMAHDKTESAFVQAMTRAKWPTHYVAMNSMSGKTRALYLEQFDSFEAWEKDNKAIEKNEALTGELEKASVADGELLDSMDQFVYSYDEDLSFKPGLDFSQAHYVEVVVFHVRQGHTKEWTELAKMAIDTYKKANTNAHWTAYHLEYGGEGGTYLMLNTDKSMSEIDLSFDDDKKYHAAQSDEERKKMRELHASAVESTDTELFSINPRQSYASEDWIKADPEFWKPKPPMSAAKTASEEKKAKQ